MSYDLIVIGSGPGGYVAAIRASQLGLKTAIVERENLGGICLNWGCIPTKALLKSAQVFEYLKHASDYGISVKGGDADFSAVVKRSRDVADGMSKGVQFLMKKNKIDVITGTGKVKAGKKVRVRLSVIDTGRGIPAAILAKVCDPFFTTKPRGLGLGLALTKRIVARCTGTLAIQSREGHGTLVMLDFVAAG